MNRRNFIKAGLATLALSFVGGNILANTPPIKLLKALDKINYNRLINQIHKDIEKVCQSFAENNIGEPIDQITRNKLVYLLQDMLNTKYHYPQLIYQYMVICNETNNSQSIIDAEKIRGQVNIQLNNCIAYHIIKFEIN